MDLCLVMVEEDEGHDIAVQVARELVLFLRRSGGQSQFSSLLDLDSSTVPSLRELRLWMLDHLREPLPVERLASKAAMSPRNFARVFVRELGTPARLVQQMRLEAARRWLEESKESVVQVASKCGFGSLDSMRRAFEEHLGITPHTHRERFRTTAIM
jgi:transcriptional regulator GlxA family with amidase domain